MCVFGCMGFSKTKEVTINHKQLNNASPVFTENLHSDFNFLHKLDDISYGQILWHLRKRYNNQQIYVR